MLRRDGGLEEAVKLNFIKVVLPGTPGDWSGWMERREIHARIPPGFFCFLHLGMLEFLHWKAARDRGIKVKMEELLEA